MPEGTGAMGGGDTARCREGLAPGGFGNVTETGSMRGRMLEAVVVRRLRWGFAIPEGPRVDTHVQEQTRWHS